MTPVPTHRHAAKRGILSPPLRDFRIVEAPASYPRRLTGTSINMKPDQTSASIVLVGKFKPSQFDLSKLTSTKALSAPDLAASTYEALLPDQVTVVVLPWGKLSVVDQRLSIEVNQVPFVRASDLALKLLREAAPTSIVRKLGINLVSHFRFADVAARDAFASRLVPPLNWGSFGSAIAKSFSEKSDRHGGLIKVTMRQARPEGRSAGWIDVTVEPSPLVANDQGAALSINDHYELSDEERGKLHSERAVSEELLSVLEAGFDKSMERSFVICDDVLGE